MELLLIALLIIYLYCFKRGDDALPGSLEQVVCRIIAAISGFTAVCIAIYFIGG